MPEDNKVKYLKDYKQPDYWVRHVDLTFDLKDGETIVRSQLQVEKNGDHNRPLVLDGEHMELLSVAIDSGEISKGDDVASGYVVGEETLSLQPCDDEFTLETVVKINPEGNTALEGLYRSSGNWCTQCEAEGFRRITYMVDRPDNMATYKVTLIADQDDAPVLLSNGNLIEEGQAEDGRSYTVWEDPFPKPSYLFALVGGKLSHIEDNFETMNGRNVTLRIYADDKDLGKLDYAMESLKQSMKWDEEVYGREYELDLFNIVAVDDFNMGAMENTSLNIFNTKYVLADPDTATDVGYEGVEAVVGHEYFHNWTGNRVTCRDWYQLCLKEGLTVFRDQMFSGDMGSHAVKRIDDVIGLRTEQFPEDAGPMTHPPRPDRFENINNFYTWTVYEKGAELNRMLHTLLGADDFRKGSDLYFNRHDGQAVTVEDWVQALSDASGRDLSQFMLWYTQAGTPTVTVDWEYNKETRDFSLIFKQDVPVIEGKSNGEPRHMPVPFGLIDQEGNDVYSDMVELTQGEQTVVIPNVPEGCVPSLFRNFSAPIILDAPYIDQDLQHLMVHDTDGFNQWDAGNRFLKTKLLEQIQAYQNGQEIDVSDDVVSNFKSILARNDMDQELKALALTLPEYNELALSQDVIDPVAITHVREAFVKKIGTELKDEFLNTYNNHYTPEKSYDLKDKGRRAMHNLALGYLAQSGDINVVSTVVQQYYNANNITDRGAAFSVVMRMDGAEPYQDPISDDFYESNKDNSLVLDKWLSMSVGGDPENALNVAQSLANHKVLEGRNPNKVRALYGGFVANKRAFHAEDGSGYEFLADAIMEIDANNPQLSAGLVSYFEQFKSYVLHLQEKQVEQLNRINSMDEISKDLQEKLRAYLNVEDSGAVVEQKLVNT